MNLLPTLFRRKAGIAPMSAANAGSLMPATSMGSGGFIGFVRESFTGAWQKNVVVDNAHSLLAFSAVYACVTLIANDIGKLRIKLLKQLPDGTWPEIASPSPFLPVLTRPNRYQNRIQFITNWIISKLLHGNAYLLKERDLRGIVTSLYILDPRLVVPLVATDGSIFYQLSVDPLSGLGTSVTVPASEIIHDRMPCLWHPLLGVSPIYACGSSATQGTRIQANSALFFENMSRPSGMLTTDGHIPDDTARRLKEHFEENYSGAKIGRLAVLGDGLKYEAMTIPPNDAQLIEQLKWTVEDVARCFHVPLHMIGSGPNPTFQNIGSLTQAYYTQTLQTLIESLELCLCEGLSLPDGLSAELDTELLLRMDTTSRYENYKNAISAGWMSPNQARLSENQSPVTGGDTPYLQQQNWSLAQLDKRDINAAPPAPAGGTAPPAALPKPTSTTEEPPAKGVEEDSELTLFAALIIAKSTEAAYAEA